MKKSDVPAPAAPTSLIVPGFTLDNEGNYHPRGTVLTIDDNGGARCITAAAAEALAAVEATRVARTLPANGEVGKGAGSGEGQGDRSGDEQAGDA